MVTGTVILPSLAASLSSPSSEIGRDTVPPGAAPSRRLSRLTGRVRLAAGCDVAEEIVHGDRQAEGAAGSGVAEQTVQADRQGESAGGRKVVEDRVDVDRNVQGARF